MLLSSPGLSEKAKVLCYRKSDKIACFAKGEAESKGKEREVYLIHYFKLKKSHMSEAQKKSLKEWQGGLASKHVRTETDLKRLRYS